MSIRVLVNNSPPVITVVDHVLQQAIAGVHLIFILNQHKKICACGSR